MDWTDVEFLGNAHLLDDIMDYEFKEGPIYHLFVFTSSQPFFVLCSRWIVGCSKVVILPIE